MNAICGLGWNTQSKLDDIQLVNEGAIAAQFIGQHPQELLAASRSVRCQRTSTWSRNA
jgi:uncharacterized protein